MHHSCMNNCSQSSLVLHSAATIRFSVSFLTKTLVRMRILFKYECRTKKWKWKKKGEKLFKREQLRMIETESWNKLSKAGSARWREMTTRKRMDCVSICRCGSWDHLLSLVVFLSLHYHVLCFLLSDKLSGVQHQQKPYSSLNSAPCCCGT